MIEPSFPLTISDKDQEFFRGVFGRDMGSPTSLPVSARRYISYETNVLETFKKINAHQEK